MKGFMLRKEPSGFRLFMEFYSHDEELLFKYTRMTPRKFDIFLKVHSNILDHEKQYRQRNGSL